MKIRNFSLFLTLTLGVIFILSSCVKDTGELTNQAFSDEDYQVLSAKLNLSNEIPEYLNVELPPHMSNSGFSIAGGEINNATALLGRVLFYDRKLSKNNAVSCASCHEQANGFADDRAFSKGFDNVDTKRNSLALGNVRFYYHDRGFMWDERAASVEDQTRKTVTDHIEMGMEDWEDVVSKVRNVDYYEVLFRRAFGDEKVSEARIQSALSMFVRSLVSKGSKWDEAMIADNKTSLLEGTTLSTFTDAENQGMQLYMSSCKSCHGNVIFLGRSKANNGLEMNYEDKGVGALTSNSSDNGVFKVPFIRNIAMTAPYMHDGRFETLEEVIEHYSSGIQPHQNLAFDLPAGGFNFTETQKANLLAFFETLNDYEMANEPKYSDPFK